MEKRILVIAVIMAVGALSSATIAGGPLGPPRAWVGQGKWLVDVEYAHEDIDLTSCGKGLWFEWNGSSWDLLEGRITKFAIEGLESDMFFGSLAYGLCDTWDVYVRLGAANAKDELEASGTALSLPGESYSFSGSHGFAWGVGTRGTFCQWGSWTLGAVGQVTWVNPGDDRVSWSYQSGETTSDLRGNVELDWRQFQAGLGVTYQADGWWVYGGPCWFFVNGELDGTLTEDTDPTSPEPDYRYKYSHDLREKSEFGCWVGVGCQLPKGMTCYAEGQFYDNGWVIGLGVAFPLSAK